MNHEHETREQHAEERQRSAPTPPDELVETTPRDIPAASERQTAVIFAVLGGAAIAISSVLPWMTAETTDGAVSISGISGHGWVALVLGVLVLGIGGSKVFRYSPRWQPALLLLVIGAGSAALVLFAMVELREQVETQYRGRIVTIDEGFGLLVLLVGACSTLAAAQRWWRGPELSTPHSEDEGPKSVAG